MSNEPMIKNTWTWKAVGAPPAAQKKAMPIQLKATLQAAVGGLVGFLMYRFWGHVIGPAIVWSIAGLLLLGGWVFPPLFHGFEKLGAKLAFGVAAGLTWGLLVPFFYIAFVGGRLVLLLSGKDPMDRAFPDAERATFWIPRPPVPSMNQYKKQH